MDKNAKGQIELNFNEATLIRDLCKKRAEEMRKVDAWMDQELAETILAKLAHGPWFK